jgi:hypothetical protein
MDSSQETNNHRSGSHHVTDTADKQQPLRVVYGYCKFAAGDAVRAAILTADLRVFCRTNGFMLSTVFTDWGVDDSQLARPGFSSLLDVCRLVGSYGVVVPSRGHLSAHDSTLDTMTLQLARIGVELIAADDVTAAGPSGAASIDGAEPVTARATP